MISVSYKISIENEQTISVYQNQNRIRIEAYEVCLCLYFQVVRKFTQKVLISKLTSEFIQVNKIESK